MEVKDAQTPATIKSLILLAHLHSASKLATIVSVYDLNIVVHVGSIMTLVMLILCVENIGSKPLCFANKMF